MKSSRWVARDQDAAPPPPIRRMPTALNLLRTWWDGDPRHLRAPDLAAAREHIAGGYHQVCPNGHPIPDDVRRRPTLPVVLVGATSVGKSLYLASVYHEAVARVRLGDHGLRFRTDSSPEALAAFKPTYDAVFGEQRPVSATRPSSDGFSRPPLMLSPSGATAAPNLLLFDADGSKTTTPQAHIENNPALLRAQVFLLFIPPVNLDLPGDDTRDMDDISPLGRTMEAIAGVIDALTHARIQGADLMACVLVSKSDKLRGRLAPELGEMLTDLDYRSFSFAELGSYIDRDSTAIRDWVDQHQHGLVTLVESFFGQVTYHFTSATGCSAIPDEHGERRFPATRPQRVLDPLVAALDRVGYTYG